MTASALDLLTRPEPPRDQWKRYMITPAAGGKALGHIRATTFAKTVADAWAVADWQQRKVAVGLATSPHLVAAVATTDPTDNKALDALCKRAMEASGANARRDLGTAIHAGTERADVGQPHGLPDPYGADIDAYLAALDAAGIRIIPDLIERICVLPDLTVAGTFDRVVEHDGRLRVLDVKTGAKVYATDFSVQLALYANAETLWDPATDTHTPMPDVERDHAIIAHLPAGEARCDLYLLDIEAGWEMVETCATVRAWRKRRDLLTKIGEATTTPAPTVVPMSAAVAATDDRVAHLTGRIQTLTTIDGAVDLLSAAWPAGVPTIRQHRDEGAPLDPWMLDDITAAVTSVEALVGAPFAADRDPGGPLLRDDPRIGVLRDRLAALPADLCAEVLALAEQAGIPKLSSGSATVADLDAVTTLIGDAEQAHTARRNLAAAHAAVLGWDVPEPVDAATLDELSDYADARLAGMVDASRTVIAGTVATLADRFGGKAGLLAAARRVAAELGIDCPRSSDALAEHPRLVARLAVTDPPAAPAA